MWESGNPVQTQDALHALVRFYIQTAVPQRNLSWEAEQLAHVDFKAFAQQLFNSKGTMKKLQDLLEKKEPLTQVEENFLKAIDWMRQGERVGSSFELLKIFKAEVTRYLSALPPADLSPKPASSASTEVTSSKIETDMADVEKDVKKVTLRVEEQQEIKIEHQVITLYNMIMNAFPSKHQNAQIPVQQFVEVWDSIGMTPNDVAFVYEEGYITGRKEIVSQKELPTRILSIPQMITMLYVYFRQSEDIKPSMLNQIRTLATRERDERMKTGVRIKEVPQTN